MSSAFFVASVLAAGASNPPVSSGPALPLSFYTDWAVLILSWAAILSGSFFVLVGSIGLIRMPDMFTRMHAASIIDTLGAGLLIAGMMMQAGPSLITLKLLFILMLFLITSPVATHALAQAALHDGEKPQLKEDRTDRPPASGHSPDHTKEQG